MHICWRILVCKSLMHRLSGDQAVLALTTREAQTCAMRKYISSPKRCLKPTLNLMFPGLGSVWAFSSMSTCLSTGSAAVAVVDAVARAAAPR